MQRPFSSFATSVLLLLVLGLLAAPTTTALGGKKQNSKTCPSDPLPDYQTPTGLIYLSSSLEAYKFKKPAAVFSFTLVHTDVELPRCDEDEISDACCATNEAQFVSVTLQLDPERCATRKALKGLKVRIDGQIIPNKQVAVKAKTGNVTIKHVPRLLPKEGEYGFEHSLDLIFPQDTECTKLAFQGRTDAWPCAQEGCDYLAVTTVDALWDKSKSKNYQGRFKYPTVNQNDCCVSYGTSEPSAGGDSFTSPPLLGVGPPPGTDWCSGVSANNLWDVRILSVGDWGASPTSTSKTENQKLVAKGMAAVAKDCDFELVINVGDNFYENGLLGGLSIPEGAKDFRERFQITWTDVYHGAYASLRNLVWYGTYGNHDIGIYNWKEDVNNTCFAPTGQTWTHEQCLTQVDCCASPLWQTTSVVNDPMWVLEPGEYSKKVYNPNAAPTAPPLIEFFFLDSNPYVQDYLKPTSSYYKPDVPGGLNEWAAVRNQTMDSFLSRIQSSTATWKIPVIHNSLASWGSHCGFNKRNAEDKSPDDPINNPLDQRDCKYFVDLRRALLNMNIPLTMHGHDHTQQFARLPAGYDNTGGNTPMYVLTTGAGCKQSYVVPGPEDIQLWPRNACGGGTPCKKDPGCTNECATFDKDDGEWTTNRQHANVGFSSLHATPTQLLVRVFEWVRVYDVDGATSDYQLVEQVQQLITK